MVKITQIDLNSTVCINTLHDILNDIDKLELRNIFRVIVNKINYIEAIASVSAATTSPAYISS